MPLKSKKEQLEVLELLEKNTPYKKIMESEEGKYEISKSSLSEYKKKLKEGIIDLKKLRAELPNNSTEPTEPKKKSQKNSSGVQEKIFDRSPPGDKKIISKLEFENLENSAKLIFNSSYKRYKNANATGMLNSLNIIKTTIEMMKKRLKY